LPHATGRVLLFAQVCFNLSPDCLSRQSWFLARDVGNTSSRFDCFCLLALMVEVPASLLEAAAEAPW
jgi:hypothetical protein